MEGGGSALLGGPQPPEVESLWTGVPGGWNATLGHHRKLGHKIEFEKTTDAQGDAYNLPASGKSGRTLLRCGLNCEMHTRTGDGKPPAQALAVLSPL